MPKLRTTVSTGLFPIGRECECVVCGERFISLDAFDAHLPTDPEAPLTCAPRTPQEAPQRVDLAGMGVDSQEGENGLLKPSSERVEFHTLSPEDVAEPAPLALLAKNCRKGHAFTPRNTIRRPDGWCPVPGVNRRRA
jgi:hypothetical protein